MIQKFTLQRSKIYFLIKDYQLAESIYLLQSTWKAYCETQKNTKRNGIKHGAKHTHPREKDNFRKGLGSNH